MKPLSGLTLERCGDSAVWDDFVAHSRQGSVYCHSDFLKMIPNVTADRWFVMRNGEPLIAVPIVRRGGDAAPTPFSYYQGPMLARRIPEMPTHRSSNYIAGTLEFMLAELSARYDDLRFSLHPELTDIRAFDWFNHHSPELGLCRTATRYTAYMPVSQTGDAASLVAAMRKDRRQDLKYATSSQFRVQVIDDADLVVDLYRRTIERQGADVPKDVVEAAYALCGFVDDGRHGLLLGAVAPDGEIISVQLALFDDKAVHAVLAASREDQRANGAGTLLALELGLAAMERGLDKVDFNGANSPRRADFKHSLNAHPVRFHTVRWSRPS